MIEDITNNKLCYSEKSAAFTVAYANKQDQVLNYTSSSKKIKYDQSTKNTIQEASYLEAKNILQKVENVFLP
jgi:hypothetical protein